MPLGFFLLWDAMLVSPLNLGVAELKPQGHPEAGVLRAHYAVGASSLPCAWELPPGSPSWPRWRWSGWKTPSSLRWGQLWGSGVALVTAWCRGGVGQGLGYLQGTEECFRLSRAGLGTSHRRCLVLGPCRRSRWGWGLLWDSREEHSPISWFNPQMLTATAGPGSVPNQECRSQCVIGGAFRGEHQQGAGFGSRGRVAPSPPLTAQNRGLRDRGGDRWCPGGLKVCWLGGGGEVAGSETGAGFPQRAASGPAPATGPPPPIDSAGGCLSRRWQLISHLLSGNVSSTV